MSGREGQSSAPETPTPLSPSLERAVIIWRTASHGRRWTSRKRQQIEPLAPKLRNAQKAGLSKCQIRERLAQDGFRVGRWMPDDLLREGDDTPAPSSSTPSTP